MLQGAGHGVALHVRDMRFQTGVLDGLPSTGDMLEATGGDMHFDLRRIVRCELQRFEVHRHGVRRERHLVCGFAGHRRDERFVVQRGIEVQCPGADLGVRDPHRGASSPCSRPLASPPDGGTDGFAVVDAATDHASRGDGLAGEGVDAVRVAPA